MISLPSLIDPHVHFRVPGLEDKEDWQTGSAAALVGGISTVFDMPNTKPPTMTIERLREKEKIVKKQARINYYFYFGATENNLAEIKKIGQEEKVIALKIYMSQTTGDLLVENKKALDEIFHYCPKLIAVHAEGEKIDLALALAKKYHRPVYICHVARREWLDKIKKARQEGVQVYAEVTPHHLFLTNKEPWTMKPSLGTEEDRLALWEAVKNGEIDTLGSDHAPHLREEKAFGVPGIETMLPLMLNAVNQGHLTLEKLTDLMHNNIMKIFNLPAMRGKTIVDMNLVKEVQNVNLKTKCRWSPFAGWKLKGWPLP